VIRVASVPAAALLAGCGSDQPGAQNADDGGDPPAITELTCDHDGPTLLTPVVRGQSDGVHVRVTNETNHEVEFDFEVTRGVTGGGGSVAPPGTSTHVVPFAAREVSLGCVPEALDRVELAVVGGELKTAECKELRSAEFVRPGREPVAVARRYLRGKGLRETDTVERAVSIAGELPVVRVVREGRVVAKVIFDRPAPNRLAGTVETCADFAE
jgi:hypothetical protein